MKCALTAFKCAKSSEKAVISCRIFINPRADSMLVRLMHTYDVVKSHEIPLLECSSAFKNIVDKNELINQIVAPSALLSTLLSQMVHDTAEILLTAKEDSFAFKNYVTREQDFGTVMKTEAKVPISEFDRYYIPKPTDVVINMKEIKALVNFAESYQAPVSLYFEQPGSPMVIALESDINFTVELMVATVDFDCSVFEPNMSPLQVDAREQLIRKGAHACSTQSLCSEASFARCGERQIEVDIENIRRTNSSTPLAVSGVDIRKRSSSVREGAMELVSGNEAYSTSEGDEKTAPGKSTRLASQEGGQVNGESEQACAAEASNPADGRDESDSDVMPESPSPPKSKKFRRFFLSSSQRTMHASQLFIGKKVIAPDSDIDE